MKYWWQLAALTGLFLSAGLRADETTAAAPAASAPVFSGEQLVVKKYMEELFETSKKVNAGGDAQKKSRNHIETSMDWERVAEDCLGKKNAQRATGQQLTEFRNLLRQVVVKTAYSRLDKFWDGTTVQFEAIDVKGPTARVAANFTVNGEPFLLEYFLAKKGGHWSVYDISYESQRYSTNNNEQLEAFLKENNFKFSHLLEKLRKRNQELDTPKAAKKKV